MSHSALDTRGMQYTLVDMFSEGKEDEGSEMVGNGRWLVYLLKVILIFSPRSQSE